MNKYGIIVDSTVYLPKKVLEDNNIKVVSLNVTDETDKTYKESEVTREFIQSEIDKGRSFHTSQPAPGKFLEAYNEFLDKGYTKVFYVGLSKELSGTYQSSLLARNMLDNPENVFCFDTNSSAYGNEMITYQLIDMIKAGKDEEYIIERLNKVIENHTLIFTMENLFSLVKGGRLSTARALVGTVLRVKPIVEMIDGKLILAKTERTYNKVFKLITDKIDESLKGYSKLHVYITNTNSESSGLALKKVIEDKYPQATITSTDLLGPVMTIHCGKKGFGISWFVE